MAVLDDSDPRWEQHSGGGRRGWAEWGQKDGQRAADFYAALRGNAKLLFDVMMDHPGEELDADWLANQISARLPGETDEKRRRMVSGSLSGVHRPFVESGRRYPFYWWQGTGGDPSTYAMKSSVAVLFRTARQGAGSPLSGASIRHL